MEIFVAIKKILSFENCSSIKDEIVVSNSAARISFDIDGVNKFYAKVLHSGFGVKSDVQFSYRYDGVDVASVIPSKDEYADFHYKVTSEVPEKYVTIRSSLQELKLNRAAWVTFQNNQRIINRVVFEDCCEILDVKNNNGWVRFVYKHEDVVGGKELEIRNLYNPVSMDIYETMKSLKLEDCSFNKTNILLGDGCIFNTKSQDGFVSTATTWNPQIMQYGDFTPKKCDDKEGWGDALPAREFFGAMRKYFADRGGTFVAADFRNAEMKAHYAYLQNTRKWYDKDLFVARLAKAFSDFGQDWFRALTWYAGGRDIFCYFVLFGTPAISSACYSHVN